MRTIGLIAYFTEVKGKEGGTKKEEGTGRRGEKEGKGRNVHIFANISSALSILSKKTIM